MSEFSYLRELRPDVPCCPDLQSTHAAPGIGTYHCDKYPGLDRSDYVHCIDSPRNLKCYGRMRKEQQEAQDKINKEIEPFTAAIKINNRDINAYFSRANVYLKHNILESAISDFKTIVTLDQNNIDALYNIGCILCQQKKYGEAQKAFNSILRVDETNANAYLKLGYIFFAMNDYDKAKKYFIMSLKYNADCQEAREYVIKINKIKKDEIEAIEEKIRKKEEEYRLIVRNFRDTIYLSLFFSAIVGAVFWGLSFVPTLFIILSILGFIISIFVITDDVKGCAAMFFCMLGILLLLIVCITLLFSDKLAFIITGAAIGMVITLIVNKKELIDFLKYEK
ncbi:MAG: tetratricopeptide repeat protein [Candidatus Cloacimonetes bacterium]|nr:tetratricopeptide repeat protein [Candidatus Cloacimonadota bacterium]